MSAEAKVTRKGAIKPLPRSPQQSSIDQFLRRETPLQGASVEMVKPASPEQVRESFTPPQESGNESDDCGPELQESNVVGEKSEFPEDHPFLLQLRNHLTSRHGKSRSTKEAKQVSREVSRYLYFANATELRKELLLEPNTMDRYLQMVQSRVGPSTQNSKLCRLRQGITFLSLRLDARDLPNATRMEVLMKAWCSSIGKEARKQNRNKLEEKSEEPVDFGDIDSFVKCHALHQLASKLARDARDGLQVNRKDLRSVTVWLAGCIMHTNHQRPGAVCNATIGEYSRATEIEKGRTTYLTFRVQNHKTATTGSAKISVPGILTRVLKLYVTYLRPLLPESDLLFPSNCGKPMDHLSRHVTALGNKYQLKLPSSTESRHTAATVVTKKGSEGDRAAVATLMSHSEQTQQRYYSLTKSREQAVKGFEIMKELREAEVSTSTRAGSRKPFTTEESEVISLFFQSYIENGDVPTKGDCDAFLEQHRLDRSGKQVRDKVRHLIDIEKKKKKVIDS